MSSDSEISHRHAELALSALNASGLPGAYATTPFAYEPSAFEQAHATLQQMEMGRTRSVLLGLAQSAPSRTDSVPFARAQAMLGQRVHCDLTSLSSTLDDVVYCDRRLPFVHAARHLMASRPLCPRPLLRQHR